MSKALCAVLASVWAVVSAWAVVFSVAVIALAACQAPAPNPDAVFLQGCKSAETVMAQVRGAALAGAVREETFLIAADSYEQITAVCTGVVPRGDVDLEALIYDLQVALAEAEGNE